MRHNLVKIRKLAGDCFRLEKKRCDVYFLLLHINMCLPFGISMSQYEIAALLDFYGLDIY